MDDKSLYEVLQRINESREKKRKQTEKPCDTCKQGKNCSTVCDKWRQWFKPEWDRLRTELQRKWGYYADRGDGA